jgi:hypothetical protein
VSTRPRIEVSLRVTELAPSRPEVLAPVAMGHWEGADRVQRPTGGAHPLIDASVGLHKPVGFGGVIGRRDTY